MTILITGASGFIGSSLTRRLCAVGHDIIAFSKTFRVDGAGIYNILGDVRDFQMVEQVLREHTPSAVIYCASRPRDSLTQLNRKLDRISGVRTVSIASQGLPFLYLSSTKIDTDPESSYADAQRQCEAIVHQRHPPGTIFRLPLIYGPKRCAWLRRIAWAIPHRVWSQEQVVDAVLNWINMTNRIPGAGKATQPVVGLKTTNWR